MNVLLMDTIELIESNRIKGTAQLDQKKRSALGQYMTPAGISTFMVSMFSLKSKMRLLDAGAGTGSLSCTFIDKALSNSKRTVEIEAWEIEPVLRDYLNESFKGYKDKFANRFSYSIKAGDFIEQSCFLAEAGINNPYTHAILNPPYKKLATSSDHRKFLRKAEIETVNLYAGFTALAILLLAEKGELVVIIPRSFCNGPYYKPFREIIFRECAIKQIHLFDSRKMAFKDDDVLQENIIIHMVKGVRQEDVKITSSLGADLKDIETSVSPFKDIVQPDDKEKFIRIPNDENSEFLSPKICTDTLEDIEVSVSTGPVVDFRHKKSLRQDPTTDEDSVPLFYSHHFVNQKFEWPKEHKKPNAIIVNDETRRWLRPAGDYVIVKRFSSKEEKRRVVAHHLKFNDVPTDLVGLENHWNFFHKDKKGLDPTFARGLCVFLNSTILDKHFRVFSGHTQVNATDLRVMKYPSREKLIALGKKVRNIPSDQAKIDKLVDEIM